MNELHIELEGLGFESDIGGSGTFFVGWNIYGRPMCTPDKDLALKLSPSEYEHARRRLISEGYRVKVRD